MSDLSNADSTHHTYVRIVTETGLAQNWKILYNTKTVNYQHA